MAKQPVRFVPPAPKRSDVVGVSGVIHYGRRGRVEDEWHPNLRGRAAVRVYREMVDNDSIIGGARNVIEWAIRQVPWRVKEASNNPAAREAKEFVESCLLDMEHTWAEFMSDVLSMLWYGWATFEKVYKVRSGASRDRSRNSRFDDGRLGWRGFFIRSQETLQDWEWDEEDNVSGWWQQAVTQPFSVFLPSEKLIHFRMTANRGSPEGRSILRNAYRPWFFMKRLQEIEAIGIERDLAGLPVIRLPLSMWESKTADRARFDRMVQMIRRNEHEGLTFPASLDREGKPTGYDIGLMNSGGQRAMSAREAIRGYQREIGINFNTQFQQLGTDGVGSNALSSDQTNMFMIGLGSVLCSIRDTLNRDPVNEVQELNGYRVEDRAVLEFGDLEKPDMVRFSTAMKTLVDASIVTPDAGLERYVRDVLQLPKRDETPDDDDVTTEVEGELAMDIAEQVAGEPAEPGSGEQGGDADMVVGPAEKVRVPESVRAVAAGMLEDWGALEPRKRTRSVVALSRAKLLARGTIPASQMEALKSFHRRVKAAPHPGTLAEQVWRANGGAPARDWVK